MSRSESRSDDQNSAPARTLQARTLEEHILAGFPPDLALDLVLNELVAQAAAATRATSAALALRRGDEIVCRASTGHLAPDLGVPINTRDGLSGACLQTRQPQLSVDTEFDPRVDPLVSRRLGIRSILIVPVFDPVHTAQFLGILEVFSPSPAAFSHNDQKLLEQFAAQSATLHQASINLSQSKIERKAASRNKALTSATPAPVLSIAEPSSPNPYAAEILASASSGSEISLEKSVPSNLSSPRHFYEGWALFLGALTIVAAIGVSFLVGSRIGWINLARSSAPILTANSCADPTVSGCSSQPGEIAASTTQQNSSATSARSPEKRLDAIPRKIPPTQSSTYSKDELVVYEKGKVIFRMSPAPGLPSSAPHQSAHRNSTIDSTNPIVEAASTHRIATAPPSRPNNTISKTASRSIWLSPSTAESRLLSRTEPQYPPEALAANLSGDVVLNLSVAEDGSVSDVSTASGNPILARAASDAVRTWRYLPYRAHDQHEPFQTSVTLSFSLPH